MFPTDESRPEVLFVCVHNAGRSQMAAALLAHHAGDRVVVRSAGSAPADDLNPAVVEAMAEVGIDLRAAGARPKRLEEAVVRASDVVITMGCGDACPIFPGKRYDDWALDDPAGQGVDAVRPIRDEIDRRIRILVDELLPAPTDTTPHRRRQSSPAVWRAADFVDDTDWIVELSADQRRELVVTARRVATPGVDLASLTAASFPLPGLSADLDAWTAQLAAGGGFLLVRGFPVDELTEHEIEVAYIGLGAHLGTPVGQNKAGDILTHIRDERLADTTGVRLYRTNQRQDFHTDGADIIGLLCLHQARRGGQSRIVSTGALYNEILDRRPDLLEVLHQPFPWDRQGEQAPGEPSWFTLAPFADRDGDARVFYIGWYIRDSQHHPDAPRLAEDQLAAMALIEEIANDSAFHVEMDFQPGDIQLLNNARILHAREAFDDDPDPAHRRHLLRLWLAAHTFTAVEDELRAGIGTR